VYTAFKKIAKNVLPPNVLRSLEPTLRKAIASFYKGNNVDCNICNNSFKSFIELENKTDLLCPGCTSIQRKRLLYHLLQNEFDIEKKSLKILHFSPNRYFEKKLRAVCPGEYITTDYESALADKNYDITQINDLDNQYDLIICYHVLEHVPDDKTAMKELLRVLKPKGTLITQVPFKDGETYEDSLITTPEERRKHFGQEDHVRWYGLNDFVNRLSNAGFNVKKRAYAKELGIEKIKRNVLNEEEIIIVAQKS